MSSLCDFYAYKTAQANYSSVNGLMALPNCPGVCPSIAKLSRREPRVLRCCRTVPASVPAYFSQPRYFRQHYRKIKLQFDVLKLRKRKRIATHINNCDDVIVRRKVHSKMYTLIRNLNTYAFLHTEIYHVAFPLENSPDFYCNVHSIRLLGSALAYLSSDVYRSSSDYLATVSERILYLNILR